MQLVDPLLDVAPGARIPTAVLQWRFSASGGPGGQHANKAASRAEVTLDLTTAPGLSDSARARLIGRFGDEVTASADDERSQHRNRQLAVERLGEKLAAALVVPRKRRATRPGRGAVKRRLEAKSRKSRRKSDRSWTYTDE